MPRTAGCKLAALEQRPIMVFGFSQRCISGMDQEIALLQESPLFSGMGREDVASILAEAQRRHYASGSNIIQENDPGDFVFLILSGRVQISKTLEPIGRQVIRVFGPGDFFGEMSILEDKPRSAAATALESAELVLLSKAHFETLLRRFPDVALNILRTFSGRLRETDRMLIEALEANTRRLQEENIRLNEEITRSYPKDLSSRNPIMQRVLDMAKKAAASSITVLLLGESGTGKEVLARAIHHWSDRRKEPFIAINCAALPTQLLESELFGHERGAFTGATQMKRGKFELADGGSVFLDEIGDMAEETQAKVLRFLQEQEFERVGGTSVLRVNVRVLAATHRDLSRNIEEGRFREDLYYRLNVVSFALLPLRERREDLQDLSDYLLRRFCREMKKNITGFAPEVREAFLAYPWPGNIRELSNVIERAIALTDGTVITLNDLPPPIARPSVAPIPSAATLAASQKLFTYQEAVESAKRTALQAALDATGGNQSRAAEMLGLERTYLSRLLKQFGLR